MYKISTNVTYLYFVGHNFLDDLNNIVQNNILYINNAFVLFLLYIVCHHKNNIKLMNSLVKFCRNAWGIF
jgi:hypothetical protein